jgi:hypothetical protein
MGLLNCAANGFVEMELARESRNSKVLGLTVVYRQHGVWIGRW